MQEQLLLGEWLDSLMFEAWGGKALTLKLDGLVYVCATNGHGLVLVAGAGSVAAPADRVSAVKNLLAFDKGPHRRKFTLSLAELRAWLPTDPDRIPCPTCNGGAIKEFRCRACHGEGVTECRECGSEKECPECGGAKKSLECAKCEGDGALDAPESAAPIAPGVTINRRVLQRYLGSLLRGEEVTVSHGGQLDAVYVYGPGWTVIVMPFNHDEEKHGPIGPLLRATVAA
jgi:hypothetical protein